MSAQSVKRVPLKIAIELAAVNALLISLFSKTSTLIPLRANIVVFLAY